MVVKSRIVWTCQSCLRARARRVNGFAINATPPHTGCRTFQSATRLLVEGETAKPPVDKKDDLKKDETEKGAMSRRLAGMAEETMDTGSKSDRKMMSDAGFSEDLKKQLEERIAQTAFAAQNQQIIGQANIPSSAGAGTRDQAAAKAWTGSESLHDSALRMLDDSHKRLKVPPGERRASMPKPIIKPPPKKSTTTVDRLVNARDRTSRYALSQQENLSEEEREKLRQELKDRFSPGARQMPTTLQGLTSLANERIEDAIARGQFKNIQRGKGVNIERDYTASSPFLDTTEYFMNKIIQRQEIVPPWIEKQQELLKLITTFRKRMRNDWKRHASRMISSTGGTVADQVRRAKGYALAEEIVNPRPVSKSESVSGIDASGNLTTITIEQKIAAGVAPDPVDDPITIKVTEAAPQKMPSTPTAVTEQSKANPTPSAPPDETPDALVAAIEGKSQPVAKGETPATIKLQPPPDSSPQAQTPTDPVTPPPAPPQRDTPVLPMSHPFRDPDWEAAEAAYHKLAIEEINALARSYNLMAPKIAQKPYYNLQRELKRCYAEVAPLLADEILERSRKPHIKVQVSMHKEGSVMGKFQGSGHHATVIRDEPGGRGYGFKQFWRDLFAKQQRKGTETVE